MTQSINQSINQPATLTSCPQSQLQPSPCLRHNYIYIASIDKGRIDIRNVSCVLFSKSEPSRGRTLLAHRFALHVLNKKKRSPYDFKLVCLFILFFFLSDGSHLYFTEIYFSLGSVSVAHLTTTTDNRHQKSSFQAVHATKLNCLMTPSPTRNIWGKQSI